MNSGYFTIHIFEILTIVKDWLHKWTINFKDLCQHTVLLNLGIFGLNIVINRYFILLNK